MLSNFFSGFKAGNIIKKIVIIAGWLLVWQLVCDLTGLELLLASPVNVFIKICELISSSLFYKIMLNSVINIMLGFVVGFVGAALLGVAAGRVKLVEECLFVPVLIMRSLPVASFIILLLIWFGAKRVSFFISFIVAFPLIYAAAKSGVGRVDKQLLQMAKVFNVPFARQIRCLYAGTILENIEANIGVALGLCFKAGVSAEVIGLAANSIGEQLYYSKLYLLTADLFAWSIIVVLLSFVFEMLMKWIIKRLIIMVRRV